ncbi:MAG: molybdopterin-dependent oxidoreductase [Desulfobacterales bacterium]|nr:molybdopterin-dependent oxidoreductase [Desulfobacterales bacterium]
MDVKKTVCMWCHNHCKVEVHVRDGRLEKIEGDKTHLAAPLLARVVKSCPRAGAAAEWFHHPERLNYPLKRAGEKGEGKWDRISWEQALDEISERLRKVRDEYGAEALAFTRGTYRNPREFTARFFNLFGSPNVIGGAGNVCWAPANVIACALMGSPANQPLIVPGKTRSILFIGTNPAQSKTKFWLNTLDSIRQGAKLIVVDPRRTQAAERADKFLQLRPGTDTALLMSMIEVIIREELYDKEFVSRWCHGFDELRKRAKEYPPDRVERITLVPAEDIVEASRIFATQKPATCYSHMGIEQLTNGIQALHARFILPAITGNLDITGGQFFHGFLPLMSEVDMEMQEALSSEQRGKMLRSPEQIFSWKAYELIQENVKRVWSGSLPANPHCHAHGPITYRAMLTGKPYPVRAAITMAANPLITQANTKMVYRGLKSLDLYVVMDFFMTPSAQIADYVLPAASWLERSHLGPEFEVPYLEAGEAAFSAADEGDNDRRTDYDFWRGLGLRLGQEEYWPWKDIEAAYDHRLAPMGYTLKQFITETGGSLRINPEEKKYEQRGFGTPTGKVELYSTILEKLGFDPLPNYEEPPESPVSTPELAKEYPLILITGGRFLPMYHSEWRQVDSFRRLHPDPVMQIHPQKAAELGIEDGDWVWIETVRGRVRQKSQYFAGISPGVVHAEHGWWFPELPGEEPWLHGMWESNINVVTDDAPEHCNKMSGGWPLRAELCKVYRVKTYV